MKQSSRVSHVIAGCAITVFLGFIYCWSVFRVYLAKDFPNWTVSGMSLNFTLANTFSCLGAFLSGKMLARISSRKVAVISACLIFCGFMIASMVKLLGGSIYVLYLFYGVIGSVGLGMSYNMTINIPPKWYPEKSGFISGLMLMMIGLGTLALSAVVERVAEAVGVYISLRVCAIAIAACILICCRWLVAPGPEVVLPTAPPAKNEHAAVRDLTNAETMRKGSFWVFFLWNTCLSAAGLLVINSAANISLYYGAAAIVGMLVSVANSVGRLIFGSVSDRIGGEKAMMPNNLVMIAGGAFTLGGALTGTAALVLIGLLFVGAAFGSNLTLRVTVLGERYGKAHTAENFGVCNLCVIPASLLGPYISGLLIDAQGGSYSGTFALVIGLALVAAALTVVFRKMKDE